MKKLTGFFKLIKFIWSKSDQLIKLFDILVKQLGNIGLVLEGAGKIAIQTSEVIKGSASLPDGAAQIIERTSTVMDNAKQEFSYIVKEITSISSKIFSINIPSVTITDKSYDVLGGVGHVDIPTPTKTDWFPLQDICTNIVKKGDYLSNVSNKFNDASKELYSLSVRITDAGSNLNQLGLDLKEAGKLLQEINNNDNEEFIKKRPG